MRKRLLASLLSLAMLLTMLPVTAFAAEDVQLTSIELSSTTDVANLKLTKTSAEGDSPVKFQMTDDIALGDTECFAVKGSGNKVEFDLKGHTLSCGTGEFARIFLVSEGAELTITDSTADSSVAAEAATPTAPVTGVGLMTTAKRSTVAAINVSDAPSTLKLKNVHYTTTATGSNAGTTLLYVSDGASLVVESSDLESKGAGMCISGNNTTGNMTATVTDSKLTSNIGPAIYMPCLIGVTVTNSTLNGGVGMRMGTLTARNCVITGQEENSSGTIDDPLTLSDTSCLWTGDGIYLFAGTYKSSDETNPPDCTIDLQDTDITASNGNGIGIYRISGETGQYIRYPQNVTVNIGKGVNVSTTATTTGDNAKKAYAVIGEGGTEEGKIVTLTQNITGGTFSTALPQGSVPDTHVVVATTESDKTTYTVKEAVKNTVTVLLDTEELTTADTPPTASIQGTVAGVKALTAADTKWYVFENGVLGESAVESFEEGTTYKAVVTVSADTDYAFTTDTKFQFDGSTAAAESPAEATETFPLTSDVVTVSKAPVAKYAVTITQPDVGGTVKVAYKDENESPVETQADTSIAEGTDVTVTATPSSNEYTFEKITVTHVPTEEGAQESTQEITTSSAEFTMPAHPVKISASFNPTTQPPAGDPVVTVTADGKSATPTANGSTVEIENVAANEATATVTIENADSYTVTINETAPEEEASPYTVALAETGNTTITITLTNGDETLTYTVIVKKASSENPGTDEISEVNVALDTSGPFVEGGSLVDATVTPSGDVAVDTKWYEGESTAPETSGTFSKAGTYKVEVTLTPSGSKTFADNVDVKLNGKTPESDVQVTKNADSIVLTISGISVIDKSDPSVTTPVTAVNVTLVIPGTLQVDAELIDAAATGGVKVTTTEWFLEGNNTPETGTFSKAGTYSAVVTMVADDGYQISADTAVTVTLNNETFTDEVATVEQTDDGQIVLIRKNVSVSDKPAVPHLITVVPNEGGSVTVDPQEAVKDTEITITVEPNAGMELASLTVKGDGDEPLVVKDNKFTMPDADVTITATFRELPVVETPAVEAEAPTIGEDGKAEVVISGVTQEAISQAIEDAKQAAESNEEAKPTVSMGTAKVAGDGEITADTASAISIPMDIVTAVADEALNQVALEAVTPIGSVTVPAYGVKNLVEQATESGSEESKITIRLDIEPTDIGAESEADPIVAYNVEFKKVAEDGTETHLDMDTAVFLKLWTPLVPRDLDKGLTVLLIDDTDKSRKVIKKEAIPSGGMVGFLAPHLSIYATTDALNAELADLEEVDVEPAPDVTPDPVEWVRLGKKQNESFGTIIIDGKKDCTYRIQLTRGAALGELTSFYVVKAAADGEFELTVTNKDIISIYEYGPTDTVYSKTFFNDPVSGRGKVTLTIDLSAYTD